MHIKEPVFQVGRHIKIRIVLLIRELNRPPKLFRGL